MIANRVAVVALRAAILGLTLLALTLFAATRGLAAPHEVFLPRTAESSYSGRTYDRLINEVFNKHPDEWGDAYIEDHVLVVNTVTRSAEDAAAYLKDMRFGGVRVREANTSIADYERAMDYLRQSGELPHSVTMYGPDYSEDALVVGVTLSAWGEVRPDDITEILEGAPWAQSSGVPDVIVVVQDRAYLD